MQTKSFSGLVVPTAKITKLPIKISLKDFVKNINTLISSKYLGCNSAHQYNGKANFLIIN